MVGQLGCDVLLFKDPSGFRAVNKNGLDLLILFQILFGCLPAYIPVYAGATLICHADSGEPRGFEHGIHIDRGKCQSGLLMYLADRRLPVRFAVIDQTCRKLIYIPDRKYDACPSWKRLVLSLLSRQSYSTLLTIYYAQSIKGCSFRSENTLIRSLTPCHHYTD